MADYHDDPLIGQTVKARSVDATAIQSTSTYGTGLLVESATNNAAQISQIGYQGGGKSLLLVSRVSPSDASEQIWGYSDLTTAVVKIEDTINIFDQPTGVTPLTAYPGTITAPMIQGDVTFIVSDGGVVPAPVTTTLEVFLVNPHMAANGEGLKFASFNDVTAGNGSIFLLQSQSDTLFEVSVQAEVRAYSLATAFYSGFTASAAQAADLHYILPPSQGALHTVLSNDGTGVLSWALPFVRWNNLQDPDGNLSLNMAAYTTLFTWNAATGANNLFTMTDTAANTGTGYVLTVATASGSAASPLKITATGQTALTIGVDGISSATAYLNEGTGNETAFTFNYTTNKATSGNDTGIKLINTDTSSPGTSLMVDLQKTGTGTVFAINNAGEVTTGSWHGTAIAVDHGGTGKTSWTQYALIYPDTTTSLSQIGVGTQYQALLSGGTGAPGWSAYTMPSTNGNPGEVLTTNGLGATSWAATASGRWSAILDPNANLSLSMAHYTSTFTYDNNTGASNLFVLTDSVTNNAATGYLMSLETTAGSTLKPFRIKAQAADAVTVDASKNMVVVGNLTGGGVITTSSEAFYLGDPSVDGTWQFVRSGDDLLVRRREGGAYVTKGQWTP